MTAQVASWLTHNLHTDVVPWHPRDSRAVVHLLVGLVEESHQDERGIARSDDGPPIAWFRDPAGNILAVVEG